MPPKRFYCRNAGCNHSSTSTFNLSKHRCKFARTVKVTHRNHSIPPTVRAVPEIEDVPPPVSVAQPSVSPEIVPEDPENDNEMDLLLDYSTLHNNCTDMKPLSVFQSVHSIISNPNFNIKKFREELPTLKSCSKLISSQFERSAIQDGFEKGQVSYHDGSSKHTATLFYKDAIQCIQKQLELCTEEDLIFPDYEAISGDSGSVHHPLQTRFFKDKYRKLKLSIMGSMDNGVIWTESGNGKSFIGFIQLFTDKTVAALKSNSFSAHAVHITLLNFSKSFRKRMIQEGHSVLGFLPVAVDSSVTEVPGATTEIEHPINYSLLQRIEREEFTNNSQRLHGESETAEFVSLTEKVRLTSETKGRHIKQEIVYASMKKLLSPLLREASSGFACQLSNASSLTCFPHLVSYCYDIPEGKDMSAVRHNLVTNRPCHRCIVTTKDLNLGLKAPPRTFRLTSFIRKKHNEAGSSFQDHLKSFSLAPWKSFLEDIRTSHPSFVPDDLYEIFTYEPLHNLHLEISKLVKSCTYQLASSNYKVRYINASGKATTSIRSKKIPLLAACNTLLRLIERDSGIAQLHVDFSTKDMSSALNGIFLQTGLRGMLEGKDYRALDHVFPFVAAFIDNVTQSQDGTVTKIHMAYSELIQELENIDRVTGITDKIIQNVTHKIENFKEMTQSFFQQYVETGLLTLKFHLLDHLSTDLSRYASLEFLNASPYEYYNTRIKQNYRKTSKRHSTVMAETLDRLGKEIRRAHDNFEHSTSDGDLTTTDKGGHGVSPQIQTQKLVQTGFKITLRELRNYCTSKDTLKRSQLYIELEKILPSLDVPVLLSLVEEQVQHIISTVMDYDIELDIVKTGFIDSFPTPSLENYCPKKNIIRYSPCDSSLSVQKRVFATNSFGPSQLPKHSDVFLKGKSSANEDIFWFAKTLLLFHVRCKALNFHKEYAFIRFYECTEPKIPTEKILNCLCLRWETRDEVDHSNKSTTDVDYITTGEHYGLVPFQSLCGVVHIVRSNYALPPFTKELPWTHHRFQVNRFFSC